MRIDLKLALLHRKLHLLNLLGIFCLLIFTGSFAFSSTKVKASFVDDYITSVTFPAGYQIGDYIEFAKVTPFDAGSAGNYEISISYTRINIAAAATYLASVSHSNPDLWRELGRTNSNGYINNGSTGHNFTVDCNTQPANIRFRIRAIATLGLTTSPLTVHIKIRSINQTSSWTALNVTGSDLTVSKFLPMTNDWSLYIGNPYTVNNANIAIKAIQNGNVGIGTSTPTDKLSVNGKIRAQEIRVESTNWPDYVFTGDYQLPSLQETERQIKDNGHLTGIPSAKEVKANGIDLGEMNAKLLQKIEELTLYLINMDKGRVQQKAVNKKQQEQINQLTKKVEALEKLIKL